MAFITKTLPAITWTPATYIPPIENFVVKTSIKRGNYNTVRGTLSFPSDQVEVPLLVMDSLGQNFPRPPNVIFVVWHGGKVDQLSDWIYKEVPRIQKRLPMKLRVIFMCGSNNITANRIKLDDTVTSMSEDIIDSLRTLDDWADKEQIKLTLANVLPRPIEQDENGSPNDSPVRIFLSKVFVNVNNYIRHRNDRRGVAQLPINLFVEHSRGCPAGRERDGSRQYTGRYYPDTQQSRIRIKNFCEDGVHLNDDGTSTVWKRVKNYFRQTRV